MQKDEAIRQLIHTWYEDWFAVDHLYSKWAADHDVTYNTLFTLYYLSKLERVSPGMIASRMALSKQTVTSTLDALEKRGYIVRETDTKDRRGRIARLTAEGEVFASRLLDPLFELEKQAFGMMTEKEQEMLVRLNHKLKENLTHMMKGE